MSPYPESRFMGSATPVAASSLSAKKCLWGRKYIANGELSGYVDRALGKGRCRIFRSCLGNSRGFRPLPSRPPALGFRPDVASSVPPRRVAFPGVEVGLIRIRREADTGQGGWEKHRLTSISGCSRRRPVQLLCWRCIQRSNGDG